MSSLRDWFKHCHCEPVETIAAGQRGLVTGKLGCYVVVKLACVYSAMIGQKGYVRGLLQPAGGPSFSLDDITTVDDYKGTRGCVAK